MHRKSACLVLPAQMALLPVTSESANSVCTGFIRVLRATFTERGPACLPADQPPQKDICQQGASALGSEVTEVRGGLIIDIDQHNILILSSNLLTYLL